MEKLPVPYTISQTKGELDNFAACSDPSIDSEIFFPHEKTPEHSPLAKAAKEICGRCVVIDHCLRFAIETSQTEGIWGGYTQNERSKIKQRWLADMRKTSA